jgi:hypothetical protein
MMKKLAAYAASPDQVPPTLFPEKKVTPEKGVQPWDYQCPQCGRGGGICDHPEGCRLDPWCDGAKCVPTPPPVGADDAHADAVVADAA